MAQAAAEAEERKRKGKEEEDRERALMAMEVNEYRKTLKFKAAPMPDFSSPFRPDPHQVPAPTMATEPVFSTTQRLGSPVAKRERSDLSPRLSAADVVLRGRESGAAGQLTSRPSTLPARKSVLQRPQSASIAAPDTAAMLSTVAVS